MKNRVKELVANRAEETVRLAKDIWSFAELSYEEYKSAAVLKEALAKEGIVIDDGIAGIPTAFTATYKVGSGQPDMALYTSGSTPMLCFVMRDI